MIDYKQMSQDEFRDILEEIVGDMSTGEVLTYGDVYSCLAEALNNEVLALWEERNPGKANPNQQFELELEGLDAETFTLKVVITEVDTEVTCLLAEATTPAFLIETAKADVAYFAPSEDDSPSGWYIDRENLLEAFEHQMATGESEEWDAGEHAMYQLLRHKTLKDCNVMYVCFLDEDGDVWLEETLADQDS